MNVKRSANSRVRTRAGEQGYTLLEVILSMCLLAVVTGAVFEQINQMQKKSSSEAMKVDQSQQARDFVDQTVRDLHMSGFPSAAMYTNPQDFTKVAAGLVSVSATQILFEGDVNNDGTVYSVNIFYVPNDANDPNCPCIRRSVVGKGPLDSLHQGLNPTYVETTHVFPPGTGAGQSGEDLFEYYDQNGGVVNIGTGVAILTPAGVPDPVGAATIASIKTVKVNVSLLTNLNDPMNKGFDRTSMSATARLNQ